MHAASSIKIVYRVYCTNRVEKLSNDFPKKKRQKVEELSLIVTKKLEIILQNLVCSLL